jgi:hypothetical protein
LPPTQRFRELLAALGLSYLELIGAPGEAARKDHWAEVHMKRDGAPEKETLNTVVWIDPALYGGEHVAGHGMPDSKVMIVACRETEAQLRFAGEIVCTVPCADALARWSLLLHTAIAATAASGCATAWARAPELVGDQPDPARACLAEVAKVFERRGKQILELVTRANLK